jgi:hypothetical protein
MNAKLAGLYKERGTSLAQAPRARVLSQQHHPEYSIELFLRQSKCSDSKNLIDTYHVA